MNGLYEPVILLGVELDDEDIFDRLINDDNFADQNILDVLGEIVKEILYSMFLEDPEDNLFQILQVEIEDGKVEELAYSALLHRAFYDKHIGKLVSEAQEKILNKIIIKFVNECEKIDWKTV